MTNNKWLDRSHPQTLYLANLLLYFNAAWWALDLLQGVAWLGIMAVAAVFAGLGLANEKKAGYWLALAVAAINLLWLLRLFFVDSGFTVISVAVSLIFAIALFGLLAHPMTRSYARIWFKKLNGR